MANVTESTQERFDSFVEEFLFINRSLLRRQSSIYAGPTLFLILYLAQKITVHHNYISSSTSILLSLYFSLTSTFALGCQRSRVEKKRVLPAQGFPQRVHSVSNFQK